MSGCIDDTEDDAGQDDEDDPCDPPTANDGPQGDGPPCPEAGMPVWRVSEPYINLWIEDIPLQYRLSSGRMMQFKLNYKQRSPARSPTHAGFGPNWECNWIGVIKVPDDSEVITNCLAGGGWHYFPTNGESERKSARRFNKILTSALSGESDSGGGFSVGVIESSAGSINRYGFHVQEIPGLTNQFLTRRFDRYGRVTVYGWVTETTGSVQFAKLDKVTDRDGRDCTLSYTNPLFPHLITAIADPYGRTARFIYDHFGRLTNIVDMAGMPASFQYDGSSAVITNLHTPYGDTGFRHFASEPDRAIEITEASGAQQLYAYRYAVASGAESPVASFRHPGAIYYRNSFHWDRKQFAALRETGATNYLNLPGTNYWLASLKHWLAREDLGPARVTDALGAQAGPVVDPATSTERSGQVYFEYQGQTDPDLLGPLQRVTQVVWNGTNYSPGTSPALAIGRNDWGRPPP